MNTTVSTTKGRLQGFEDNGVAVFRGIPFALPPTGDRRFRAPEPAAGWEGDRDASRSGPGSIQLRPALPEGQKSPFAGMFDESGLGVDEDCLTLNVWTPGLDTAKRPVMVWVHGGAFRSGTGGAPMYDGTELAKRGDVVVVTVNYRLGYLGFLYLPELGGGANFGILDQVMALRWVRDEIASFGGDPENVTIFGESAGAKSVETLLATAPARGLFHKAIMQSTYDPPMSPEAGAAAAGALLAELGLDRATAGRLRELPADEIAQAQLRLQVKAMASGTAAPTSAPTVDGEVIPSQPATAIARGELADVPVLIGTNLDEWKLFAAMQPGIAGVAESAVPARIMGATGDLAAKERIVAEYKRARSARGADTSPFELLAATSSDSMFRIHSTALAAAQAEHQPQTFMFLFSWQSPASPVLGACHGLDIPFVFRTLDSAMGKLAQGDKIAEAEALASAMQDAWVAFARTGNPNHPGLPEWPAYDAKHRWTMVFDAECRTESAPLEAERLAWAESPVAAAV